MFPKAMMAALPMRHLLPCLAMKDCISRVLAQISGQRSMALKRKNIMKK